MDIPAEIAISARAFSALIGCSEPYVSKLRRNGRLVVDEKGNIYPEASHKRIQETRDPGRGLVGKEVEPKGDHDESGTTYAEARAKRESYRAERERLALEKDLGVLVERRSIELAGARLGTDLRQALERMEGMLAARLAAETEEARVRQILQSEFEALLRRFADDMARAANQYLKEEANANEKQD